MDVGHPTIRSSKTTPTPRVGRRIRQKRRALAIGVALACAACSPRPGPADEPAAPPPSEQAGEQQAPTTTPLAAALAAYAARAAVLDGLLSEARGAQGSLDATHATALDGLLRELLELAVPVLEHVVVAHPGCSDHLTLVLDARGLVDALGPAELARVWVHDGSLPPAPARCQHAQDLLARPAQALAVLNARGGADARRATALLAPLPVDIAEVSRGPN